MMGMTELFERDDAFGRLLVSCGISGCGSLVVSRRSEGTWSAWAFGADPALATYEVGPDGTRALCDKLRVDAGRLPALLAMRFGGPCAMPDLLGFLCELGIPFVTRACGATGLGPDGAKARACTDGGRGLSDGAAHGESDTVRRGGAGRVQRPGPDSSAARVA